MATESPTPLRAEASGAPGHGYLRAPIVIGRVAPARLGDLLNTVPDPVFECPRCAFYGPMQVFVRAVRWPCGHTRSLPEFGVNHALLHRLKEAA